MGLASALSTALTGLTAAETQIDVVGNNLANSQTVGFKASKTVFATQFLRTLSFGSAPSAGGGGTNPRQIGLGTDVAEISPDFSQGTIEISTNPSDLAIQGDGFFIVEGGEGEKLYTRNGIFTTNAENVLTTVTGERLLGFGVDENFNIQQTTLTTIDIPVGTAAVAQATQNVFFEGNFTPTGDVADTAEVIESRRLGDVSVPRPDTTNTDINIAAFPDLTLPGTTVVTGAAGTLAAGSYEYQFTFADAGGTESLPLETALTAAVGANGSVTFNDLPTSPQTNPPDVEYSLLNVYRRDPGSTDFLQIAQVAQGAATFTDDGTAAPGQVLDPLPINGNYSYLVTFFRAGEEESRPSVLLGPQNVINGRVHLSNLPQTPTPPADGSFPAYDQIRIYRNLATDSTSFHLVATVPPGSDFTDNLSDAAISANKLVDLDGPRADVNTRLVDILARDEFDYESLFSEGTLSFQGRKGGRLLESKDLEITSTTTLQEYLEFTEDVMGIQDPIDDPQSAVPGSVNNIPGETLTLAQGALVRDGKIRLVSNNGLDNALSIGLSAYQLVRTDATVDTPNLAFGSIQEAQGQSATADLLVYDSLGIPLNVRVTAVLEERTGTSTVYRWFADSPDNDPLSGQDISVGTGRVFFDGVGNFVSATNDTVSIERRNVPSATPLEFNLNFTEISGLAQEVSELAAARQDGSAAGTLTNFIVGEDGVIRGVFSNGVTRDLGQIRLARFSNATGLVQRGENLYSQGVNSGLPVEGNAGTNGIGTVVAGAVELSNTDVGQNLVDLVLATTQYRGNARVITAAQQLLDELLNLRR